MLISVGGASYGYNGVVVIGGDRAACGCGCGDGVVNVVVGVLRRTQRPKKSPYCYNER